MAVVEAHGVGYGLNISLNTYSAIQGKKSVKLFVYEAIMTGGRDDNYTLYGFATKQERSLYRLLITVSGVGANTARMILSSLTPAELCNVIANGDDKMLKSVKGIGLKTAQRIIVDLKDKILQSGIAEELRVSSQPTTANVNNAVKDEAVGALTMLGFSPVPSAKIERCNPGSFKKLRPTTSDRTIWCPICSFIVTIAIGTIASAATFHSGV